MNTVEPLAIVILVLYLAGLIAIGFFSSKKSAKGMTSFFLAGRNLNKWTVALSAVSSGRSAWLVLGVTGMAYATGIHAVWAIAGYIMVEVFMFFYVAKRFRSYSEKTGSITVPDILENRFNDKSHLLRIVSAAIIIFFMISYVGSQLVAGGGAFATSMGVETSTGMWLTAIILLAYTMLGGFHAVSKTDVLQAGFMFVSLVVLPIIAIFGLGGFGPVLEAMYTEGSSFINPFALGFGAVIGLIGIGFGSPGNPHILVRYMALKNIKEMRQAALISSFWNVIMGWGAIMIGLAGRAYFPDVSLLPNQDQEQIFLTLGAEVVNPLFLGILLVAILAAIMSSADSQLLVGSSSFVRDIYQKIVGKDKELSQKHLVYLSRMTTVVFMGLALLLAFTAEQFVFWMVLFAWGGLGACFGPALLLSLYWKRTTKAGVLSGMIVGLITVILVKQQPQWTFAFLPDIKELVGRLLFGVTYEAVPGFIFAFIVTVVVSYFTKKPSLADETIDELSRKT